MAKLFERIQTALRATVPSATVARVISDARAALEDATARKADAKAISLDPLAGTSEIAAARASASAYSDECERLESAIGMLERRKVERFTAEEDARRELRYAEVKQRRDALVSEVEASYRAHVEALADLAARLAASNAELEAVNRDKPVSADWLFDAETIARRIKRQNAPGMRIVDNMVLPSPVADEHSPTAWPRRAVGGA